MKKQHFVFFDSAYQGFASDDIDEDTYSLKLFAKKYLRVMLAQSFSKNFGLYGERTGCLSLICTSPEERDIVQTRLKETCLPEYSNPPVHGARIVDTILGDEELTALWKAEVLNLKLFAKKYLRVMLAQSFSKNFGLYGERTGCLSLICTSPEERDIVQTRLKETCLPEYSNPPVHGARIVDTILGDEELTALWKAEVLNMSQRLRELRVQIVLRLKALGSVHDWSHITKQIGMFAYTGLTPEMVKEVIEKHSIYMPPDGRISVAGVNSGNIDHVCQAFHAVSHGKEL